MVKIALALGPEPTPVWTLAKQAGVEYVVGGMDLNPIPNASDEQQPWSYMSLARMKAAYEDGGFNLQVIESRPPMEKIKLGLPGRDDEIDIICEFIRNMGALGIRYGVLRGCRFFFVLRTSFTIPSRGGSQVSGYDHDYLKNAPLTDHGVITEEQQWAEPEVFSGACGSGCGKSGCQIGDASGRSAVVAHPRGRPNYEQCRELSETC